MEEGARAVPCGAPTHLEVPPGVSGHVVLTWGPSAQLVPEGQALGGHGGRVGLGGEGSHVPCRQGDPARVHHHVVAWGRETPVLRPLPSPAGEH